MSSFSKKIKNKYINFINSQTVKTNAYHWGIQFLNLPVIYKVYAALYWPQIRKKSQDMPKNLVIEPYNVCNLECIMCPYPDMTREKVRMDLSLFKKIIDDAVDNNFRSLSLSLYNEPFMDKSIFEKIKYAKEKGLEVTITTNGTILTDDMIKNTMESGIDYVTFSIDSLDKESYEKIRVNATFETTINNVQRMIEYRKINNYKKPIIAMSAVRQLENDSSLDHLEELLKGLDLYAIAVRDNRKDGSPIYKEMTNTYYPCWWPWNQFIVYSNGKTGLCCMDSDNAYELGDMNTQTIPEVWNSAKFTGMRELHLNGEGHKIDLCVDCDIPLRQSPFFWWYL
jgi:pyruvate-formate lyase-activating enzyme